MTALSVMTLIVSLAALAASGLAYYFTQRTWLMLAATARLQAETWGMLDRYDLADRCLADAADCERRAWPFRDKAVTS